jgi:hypothetical protein
MALLSTASSPPAAARAPIVQLVEGGARWWLSHDYGPPCGGAPRPPKAGDHKSASNPLPPTRHATSLPRWDPGFYLAPFLGRLVLPFLWVGPPNFASCIGSPAHTAQR